MKLLWLNVSMLFVAISLPHAQGQARNVSHIGNMPAVLLSRGKRYLDFTKGARMSWRTNVKNNIIKVNTLWGYGFGFRVNFPFPDKSERRRPFYKRDVFQGITDVLDAHGLDGQACILKSFCTAHFDTDGDLGKGMLFKLLKFLFKSGFDGQACILKAYCSAHMDDGGQLHKGMLFKLFKYIFTLNEEDKRHMPFLHHDNCQQILHTHCPLSFNSISPYTDDV